MDTQSLRLFVLASETLNISAAGRTLGMAPAVASTRIAKLERLLGAELLHRSTRKISLSSEGQDFLPYAREMIAQEEAALAALGQGQTKISGTLRFAAPSTFAQMYIAPLLPTFMEHFVCITRLSRRIRHPDESRRSQVTSCDSLSQPRTTPPDCTRWQAGRTGPETNSTQVDFE